LFNICSCYVEVLKYHIVPGGRRIKDLKDGQVVYTLHGTPLTITKDDDNSKCP